MILSRYVLHSLPDFIQKYEVKSSERLPNRTPTYLKTYISCKISSRLPFCIKNTEPLKEFHLLACGHCPHNFSFNPSSVKDTHSQEKYVFLPWVTNNTSFKVDRCRAVETIHQNWESFNMKRWASGCQGHYLLLSWWWRLAFTSYPMHYLRVRLVEMAVPSEEGATAMREIGHELIILFEEVSWHLPTLYTKKAFLSPALSWLVN